MDERDEIVLAVASRYDYHLSSDESSYECDFCDAREPAGSEYSVDDPDAKHYVFRHDPNCIVVKARRQVAMRAGEQGEKR